MGLYLLNSTLGFSLGSGFTAWQTLQTTKMNVYVKQFDHNAIIHHNELEKAYTGRLIA